MALTDNLIAFWEMEEASGTRNDSVGTNHLADHNTVTQLAGKVGNAAQFTAANNEWLDVASNANLATGPVIYVWSLWVYLDSKSAFRWLLGKYGAAGNREFIFWYNSSSDRFIFRVFNSVGISVDVDANNFGSPSVATWYHLMGWFDPAGAGEVGVAINNGTPDTVNMGGGTHASAGTYALELGVSSQLGTQHDGRMDQVGFWKGGYPTDAGTFAGARSALYNGGAGLSYAAMSGGPPPPTSLPFMTSLGGQRLYY